MVHIHTHLTKGIEEGKTNMKFFDNKNQRRKNNRMNLYLWQSIPFIAFFATLGC
jgi:hypothetical protein